MPRTTATADPAPDTRPLLDRARSAAEGYDTAVAAVKAIKARKTRLVTAVDHSGLIEDALEQVLDGVDFDTIDLGGKIATDSRAAELGKIEANALDWLADRARHAQRERLLDGLDTAMGVVAAELDDVIGIARPLATALAGTRDAETAIDRDVVDEWRSFGRVAARYAKVRQAQLVLLSVPYLDEDATDQAQSSYARLACDMFGHVRHPEVIAEITDAHRAGRTREDTREGDSPSLHGNPVISRALPWLHPDPAEALRVVLTDGADPWCPTGQELAAAQLADADAREAEKADKTKPPRKVPRATVLAAGFRGVDV